MGWMHATPHTNVFGVTTHYGTHPHPPSTVRRRTGHATHKAAVVAVAAALTLGAAIKRLR